MSREFFHESFFPMSDKNQKFCISCFQEKLLMLNLFCVTFFLIHPKGENYVFLEANNVSCIIHQNQINMIYFLTFLMSSYFFRWVYRYLSHVG